MISGEKITLRELRSSDSSSINKWRNNLFNKIITQGFRGPVSMEIDEKWLNEVLGNEKLTDVYFGILLKGSDELMGIVQLNNIDYISGVSTCGILIGDKSVRGKGIGVYAVRAVLFYAFFVLNLRKVITYILGPNAAAFKVQEKIGKVYKEGCLKKHFYFNDEFVDLHIQSFFKEDFLFLKNEYSI